MPRIGVSAEALLKCLNAFAIGSDYSLRSREKQRTSQSLLATGLAMVGAKARKG